MSNFNNNSYQSLVADLIGDTFYKDTYVAEEYLLLENMQRLLFEKY